MFSCGFSALCYLDIIMIIVSCHYFTSFVSLSKGPCPHKCFIWQNNAGRSRGGGPAGIKRCVERGKKTLHMGFILLR